MEGETREEDVVACGGGLAIGFADADEGGAGDLDDGGDDVAGYEDGDNEAPGKGEGAELVAVGVVGVVGFSPSPCVIGEGVGCGGVVTVVVSTQCGN